MFKCHRSLRLAGWTLAFLSALAASQGASACDAQTDRWVSGATSYWHGALGQANYCNNASVGPDRDKARTCAWNSTIAKFGPPSDAACAKASIETSTAGTADLDNFVKVWKIATGADCSATALASFYPYWGPFVFSVKSDGSGASTGAGPDESTLASACHVLSFCWSPKRPGRAC